MKLIFRIAASVFSATLLAACSAHSTVPSAFAPARAANARASAGPGHVVAEYPISGQSFDVLSGPDGNIWFTEVFAHKVGRITPDGTLTEFPAPIPGLTRFATVGPDGNIWFTLAHTSSGGYLGTITSAGTITLHSLPTTGPRFLTLGSDGNLWYTDDSNVIGRFSLGGAVSTFQIPTANSQPRGITTGADGALWFVEFGANQIGRVSTSGSFTEYPVSAASGADWLVNGHVWFSGNGNALGKIAVSGNATELALPDLPGGLLRGDSGRIWVTLQLLNKIGLMDSTGKQLQTYDIPTPHANPVGLAAGTDGNIYFSEPGAAQPQIGVLRP